MVCLNLGSGKKYKCSNYKEKWVNVDRFGKADLNWDLNKMPYPFKNEYFDLILAEHIIEHLDDPYEVVLELYRIVKNHGKIIVKLPSNQYSICHKRGTHMIGYFYVFDKSADKNQTSSEMMPLFDVTVRGHVRSIRRWFVQRVQSFCNWFVTEWEYQLVRNDDE